MTGRAHGALPERPSAARPPVVRSRGTRVPDDTAAPPLPGVVHETVRSPGAQMDPGLRAAMGSRFGHDFSRVRVHCDERAARSAEAVDALAYTVGDHIAFARGLYRPHTPSGRALLAHELAHVTQNHGRATTAPLTLGGRDSEAERDADMRVAHAFATRRRRSADLARPAPGHGSELRRAPGVAPPGAAIGLAAPTFLATPTSGVPVQQPPLSPRARSRTRSRSSAGASTTPRSY